jgi:hypothetical protein
MTGVLFPYIMHGVYALQIEPGKMPSPGQEILYALYQQIMQSLLQSLIVEMSIITPSPVLPSALKAVSSHHVTVWVAGSMPSGVIHMVRQVNTIRIGMEHHYMIAGRDDL